MGIETALIGGAILSSGASMIAGDRAADASERGLRRSSDTQLQMFEQNREDFAPYRETGTRALNQLASLYGLGSDQYTKPMGYDDFLASDSYIAPETIVQNVLAPGEMIGDAWEPPTMQQTETLNGLTAQEQYDRYLSGFSPRRIESVDQPVPDYSAFIQSPDYQFAYDQGMRSVQQALAKSGYGGPNDSGMAMKKLMRFGQGLASQQFSNYKNTLASLAGVGQSATSQLAGMGQQVAANVGRNQQNAGDTRASSYLNTGTGVSNLANNYGQMRLLQAGGYI